VLKGYFRIEGADNPAEGVHQFAMLVWDVGSLSWVRYSPSTGGGAGGGDASAANQALEISQLTAINAKLGSLGQKTMSGSAPVVLASDQPAIPTSVASLPLPSGAAQEHTAAATPSSVRLSDGSAFFKPTTPTDTQPISAAALPLPTGAATEGKQDTGNASAASIDAKLSNQANGAKQDVGNASMASVDGKLATLGQKAMAGSVPVVLSSDQIVPMSASALPLPSGAATELTLAGIPIAQSATLGTNKQVMAGAAVGASSPAYTDGQVSPLSQTPDARLRVDSRDSCALRLAELQSLRDYEQSYRNLALLEPAMSERRGFEIR
jgi:hypothetical protein